MSSQQAAGPDGLNPSQPTLQWGLTADRGPAPALAHAHVVVVAAPAPEQSAAAPTNPLLCWQGAGSIPKRGVGRHMGQLEGPACAQGEQLEARVGKGESDKKRNKETKGAFFGGGGCLHEGGQEFLFFAQKSEVLSSVPLSLHGAPVNNIPRSACGRRRAKHGAIE